MRDPVPVLRHIRVPEMFVRDSKRVLVPQQDRAAVAGDCGVYLADEATLGRVGLA